jgi:hypothetical protein
MALALLCYVESTIFGSNSVLQQGQQPISRTNHGCIACNACSHVTPEVFFGAQVDHRHKQIRYGSQDQMVMEALPRPTFIMVQSQVSFAALEELLDRKTPPT